MDNRVTQLATIFDALGCQSRYNSSDATITIVEAPKGYKTIVDKALKEISHYDDTRNYIDGMAALCIADFIDEEVNPISKSARHSILSALGIMKDERYIHQALVLQKNNRSWHFSNVPESCAHFGEECTHRGINPDPERKGRRSARKPKEYHTINGKGEIIREQLVTSGLKEVFMSIPEDNLISAKPQIGVEVDLRAFKRMPLDEQIKIISDLQEAIA